MLSSTLCTSSTMKHQPHNDVQAARRVKRECPGIDVQVFSDRDIADKRSEMEAALQGADVFFGSLLFDYDQVSIVPPPQLCHHYLQEMSCIAGCLYI